MDSSRGMASPSRPIHLPRQASQRGTYVDEATGSVCFRKLLTSSDIGSGVRGLKGFSRLLIKSAPVQRRPPPPPPVAPHSLAEPSVLFRAGYELVDGFGWDEKGVASRTRQAAVQLEYREPDSGVVAWSRLGHFTLGSEKDGWVVLVRNLSGSAGPAALAPACDVRRPGWGGAPALALTPVSLRAWLPLQDKELYQFFCRFQVKAGDTLELSAPRNDGSMPCSWASAAPYTMTLSLHRQGNALPAPAGSLVKSRPLRGDTPPPAAYIEESWGCVAARGCGSRAVVAPLARDVRRCCRF